MASSENKLQEIIQSSLENIRSMIDANTVIGNPISTDNEKANGGYRKTGTAAAAEILKSCAHCLFVFAVEVHAAGGKAHRYL